MFQKLKLLVATLEGRKTYIIATVTTILNVVLAVNPTLLTSSELIKINAILIALGAATLHAAVVRN